jgi:hypothetical protein
LRQTKPAEAEKILRRHGVTPSTGHTDAGRQQYPVARKPDRRGRVQATSPFSIRKPLATWMTISGETTTVSQKISSQAGIAHTVRHV